LSVIISKATGKSTLEFANEYLFTPLNIETVNWEKRNQGYYDGAGFGLEMKPRDLLKIGQVIMHNGNYNSHQIISPEWTEKLFDANEKTSTQWGLKNSTHGYCWYKAVMNNNQVDYGMGYGGQFIVILPEKSLVIIATHNHDTPDGIKYQTEFLNTKLPELIEKYST
jgi:CubicO group peptidase (beta-lactamase class C family)